MRMPTKGSYWIEKDYPESQPIRILDHDGERVILDPQPFLFPVDRMPGGAYIYNGVGPVELHINLFKEFYRKPKQGELELAFLAFAGGE